MSPLHFRIINFLAFNTSPLYKAIADEITHHMQVPVTFEEGDSFATFFKQKVAVAYVCGLPYVKLRKIENAPFELLCAPVLSDSRYAGQPVYFSDVIVAENSDYASFTDLKGSSFAFNESISYSGYHVVEHYLATMGLTWSFFQKLAFSGAHLNSLKMVIEGKADSAAIDSMVLDVAMRLDPSIDQKIRKVATIGPNPIPPVVVGKWLPQEHKDTLQDIYLNLHKNPDLQTLFHAFGFSHFCKVDQTDYDIIDSLVSMSPKVFIDYGQGLK